MAVCCSSHYLETLNTDSLIAIRKKMRPMNSRPWLFVLGDGDSEITGKLAKVLGAGEYRCYTSVQKHSCNHSIYRSLVKALINNYGFESFLCLYEDPIFEVFEKKTSQETTNLSGNTAVRIEADNIGELRDFVKDIKSIVPNDYDRGELAKAISDVFLSDKNYLYIDISTLVHFDHATGIQRVVKELSSQLLSFSLPVECRLIFSYPEHTHFYYVDVSEGEYKPAPPDMLESVIVDFSDGDKILFLDLHPSNAYTKNNIIRELQLRGVESYFVVYDLLPISHPHCFVPELVADFERWLSTVATSNGALCISRDVRDKLGEWFTDHRINTSPYFRSDYFYLGANFDSTSKETGERPKQSDLIEKRINDDNINVFIMVGTIEPRKGHRDILDAFDKLWEKNSQDCLIIVGKVGWKNEGLISRLQSHSMLGNKLFWLQGVSDEYLDYLYRNSTCLIAASEGEGFGLPLIEAAQYDLPIIARDINVFKEVAGNNAYYFDENRLVQDISDWVGLYKVNAHPQSKGMPYLTWKESAEDMLNLLGSLK